MALPTDHRVIESAFSPRRLRRPLVPFLPRADRISRVPGLDGGLVPPYLVPLLDQPAWDWQVFDGQVNAAQDTDEFVVGPLSRAGSHVRYVLVSQSLEPASPDLSGWRLYFTPTVPTVLADLLDTYETYPIQRMDDGTPVPSRRWGDGFLSRTSPTDRLRNFPGYYTFRYFHDDPDPSIVRFRVIIRQPLEPF